MIDLLSSAGILRPLRIFSLGLLFAMLAMGRSHGQEIDNIFLSDQTVQISFWRVSHGLPSWHIRDMVSGPNGRVSMATDKGLVSFDGKFFKVHSIPTDGIEAKDLHRILFDSFNRLWLFYEFNDQAFIYIYDVDQNEVVPVNSYIGRPLTLTAPVLKTLCKVDDTIWILDPGTNEGGYFGPSGRWTDALKDTSKHKSNYLYYPASNGNFWAVNNLSSELYLINKTGSTLERYAHPGLRHSIFGPTNSGRLLVMPQLIETPKDPSFLMQCVEGKGVQKLKAGESASLDWGNDLNFSDNSRPTRSNNKSGTELIFHLFGLDLYSQGNLIYQGLDKYLKDKYRISLDHNIYLMEDQSFWLFGNNVLLRLMISPNYFSNILTDQTHPPSTRGLATMGKTMYLNSYAGAITVNLDNKKWHPTPILYPHPYGLDLQWNHGELWSGHHGNTVSVYSPKTGKARFYPLLGPEWIRTTYSFFFNGLEDVYIGSSGGLFKFQPEIKAFEKIEFDYPSIFCFHKNAQGVWMGTSKGLFLLDSGKALEEFEARNVFPQVISAAVRSIYEDKDGIFWLATENGLWRWKPFSTAVEVFNQKTVGFPSNRIHAIYEDTHGRLWISSDGGLICFNKASRQFRTFTATDGLPSTELNYLSHCRDQQGRLYFGGVAGITSFHPDSIKISGIHAPSLFLTRLELRDEHSSVFKNVTKKALIGDQPISSSFPTDQIKIGFFSPNFNGNRILYRWRIPELDSNWNILSEPEINLYHPPHGNLTVEIEASFDGSQFSPASLRIPLTVERPYYMDTTFWVMVSSALSFLTMAFFSWYQKNTMKINDRLTREIAEKTLLLEQDHDLIKIQAEQLKNLDQEKSKFFQDLSHEIRNPLTLILGPVSELLKQKDVPRTFQEKLELVKRNTQKIKHLVEEMLELTRLEAGVVPLEFKVLDLAPFAKQLITDFELQARQQGITLLLDQNIPDELKIRIDANKLEKILSNLIGNALKFTPAGGTVVLQTLWLPEIGLRFLVQDTGIGIAPNHLERIFDRYYQIPNEELLAFKKGLGIGLAMCKSYVNLMGGEIHAESLQGQGTSIWLILPNTEIQMSEPLTNTVSSDLNSRHKSGVDKVTKRRILLVDDEPEVLQYLSALMLEHYEVIQAQSGEEAQFFLWTNRVELIISDLMMEKINGMDLLKRIREEGVNKDTPFLLLTGYLSKESLQQAANLGCNGYLSKPVNEQQLLGMVDQLLM